MNSNSESENQQIDEISSSEDSDFVIEAEEPSFAAEDSCAEDVSIPEPRWVEVAMLESEESKLKQRPLSMQDLLI